MSAAWLAAARDFNQGAQQNALQRGYFSQGALEWFAFTSQSLVAYLLPQWSCGGVFGGWEALYHCIQHKTNTLQNSPLLCLKKKKNKIQYVNLQGRKWNLGIYLICIKRQEKKRLRLMHFSLFRTHSIYICSVFCLCCNFSWEVV